MAAYVMRLNQPMQDGEQRAVYVLDLPSQTATARVLFTAESGGLSHPVSGSVKDALISRNLATIAAVIP